jgi:hypothetical protein
MSKNHHPVVAPQDRVPVWQKTAYGAGCVTGTFSGWVSTNMHNAVFNIAMGISPATIGTILMVYRLWDSMTDVVMGIISDNARTRWGPMTRSRRCVDVWSAGRKRVDVALEKLVWLPT